SPSSRTQMTRPKTAMLSATLVVTGLRSTRTSRVIRRLQPVTYYEVRRPVTRMSIALVSQQFYLSLLKRFCLGDIRVIPQLRVEIRNQWDRRLIVHKPKGGKGASCARLDRNTGEAQRCAIVTSCCLASAQRKHLHRFVAELTWSN